MLISRAIARDEVDDARRQACGLQHLERVITAQNRARCGLPDDGIPHQRWRGGQVAADSGEVERRDRVDESFERAILHLVPDARPANRLLAVQFLREVRVEPPEVDHLRRRVDLGLKGRLRLPEHRRRVEGGAPCRRQQLGGAQQHRSAILPRPASPLASRLGCGRDRLLHLLGSGQVVIGEHVLVVVRHDRLRRSACAHFLAANDERNVELLRCHRAQPRFEFSSFRRARSIRSIRIVDRLGHPSNAVERSNGCRAGRVRLSVRSSVESESSKSVWTYRLSLFR